MQGRSVSDGISELHRSLQHGSKHKKGCLGALHVTNRNLRWREMILLSNQVLGVKPYDLHPRPNHGSSPNFCVSFYFLVAALGYDLILLTKDVLDEICAAGMTDA